MIKLSNFIKTHRWEFYGLCSVVGLLLAIYPLIRAFAPNPSNPVRTTPQVSVTVPKPVDEIKRRIAEHSAGQITKVSKSLSNSHYSEDKLEELFLERWINPPGWTGTVTDLPEKSFSENWRLRIAEDRTGELFTILSNSDQMAKLREGDRVNVSDGKISSISRNWNGNTFVTLDEVSFQVLPKLSGISHWWLRYSSYVWDWLSSPVMFFAYIWWGWMILAWIQNFLRVRRLKAIIKID